MSASPATAKPAAPPKLTFVQQVIAGGVAGVTEICVMYPLDTLKTRSQLSVGKSQPGNMFSALASMIRTDGLGVYRGIVPPILVEAPKRAVKFSANGQFSNFYSPIFGANGKPTQLVSIMSGVSAGLVEAFVVVPAELIKIRLQNKENLGKYSGTIDAFQKTIRYEGIGALYKGLEATLWRHGVWNGFYFGLIHRVKQMVPESKTQGGRMFWDFVAGTVAGTVATTFNNPPDVVKSRIQNSTDQGPNAKYRWTIPSLAMIYKEEGFSALYKGYGPKVVRLGPGGGLLLVVFNIVSQYFTRKNVEKANAAAAGLPLQKA